MFTFITNLFRKKEEPKLCTCPPEEIQEAPPITQAVEVPEAPVSVSPAVEEQIVVADAAAQEKKSASGKRKRNSKKK